MAKPVGPAWPYYGGKWNACTSKTTPYPAPLPGLPVIEPFAGAANYCLAHQVEKAILIDASPYVYGCWQYLKSSTPEDILSLPDISTGESVRDLFVAQEAKWLIGFHANPGSAQPRNIVTKRAGCGGWNAKRRERLAEISSRIQEWEIFLGNYQDAPDIEATWFIDPPYNNHAGLCYDDPYSLNFKDLGEWCRTRKGLVIVCENEGADWLPFIPCQGIATSRNVESFEVVWINRTC